MPTIRNFSTRIISQIPRFPKVLDEFGYDRINKSIVKVGTRDVIAFINASARESLLSTKLNRYLAGDLLALGNGNQKGIYCDVSGFPTDYNSIRNSLNKVNEFLKKNNSASVGDFLKSLADKVNNSNTFKEEDNLNVNEE